MLGELHDARALDPLTSAPGDRDADIPWLVARALGKLGKPEAVDPLVSKLHDADTNPLSVRHHGS